MCNVADSGTRMLASLMLQVTVTTVLVAAVVQAGAAPTGAGSSTKPHILHFMADGQCIPAVAAPISRTMPACRGQR